MQQCFCQEGTETVGTFITWITGVYEFVGFLSPSSPPSWWVLGQDPFQLRGFLPIIVFSACSSGSGFCKGVWRRLYLIQFQDPLSGRSQRRTDQVFVELLELDEGTQVRRRFFQKQGSPSFPSVTSSRPVYNAKTGLFAFKTHWAPVIISIVTRELEP